MAKHETEQKQDPRFTRDGKLTLWGLHVRYIERIKSDRFSGYDARTNDISGISQTTYGKEAFRSVVAEAIHEGLIKIKETDPYEEFARKTTPKAL